MNKVELLHATVAFRAADHEYDGLIAKTFIIDGKFYPSATPALLRRIRQAKEKRDELERKMYSVWAENGLHIDGEEQ